MNKNKLPKWEKVSIEINSNCNRDCHFCPRYLDRSGIRKDINGKNIKKQMPTKKVFSLLDQVADLGFNGYIGFHRLSESFFDKRLIEFISYAKSKGMKYLDSTNGDTLKHNAELCNQLDGLADVLIIGLYDYKNNSEKQKEIEFWRKKFKKTEIRFSLPLDNMRIRQNSKTYEEIYKDEEILNQACFKTKNLKIRYDGNLALCCQDDLYSFGLGNVFESSIKEVWFSDKHISIINDLKKQGSRHKYALCKHCYIQGTGKKTKKSILHKVLRRLKVI